MTDSDYQQGQRLELEITDLTDTGEGIGRYQDQVVFVPDTIPGDRIIARLIHVKRKYAIARLEKLITHSSQRIRPACIVADKCGGCQWQHIDYDAQLTTKQHLVVQALEHIGGFPQPPVSPILPSPSALHYRNKATYPLSRSSTGQVQAGYYQKGSHRLINLNQCPVQDENLDPFLANIKQDIQEQGWSIYNEQQHRGLIRHLSLRIGRRTGEILLTLVACRPLPRLEEQAETWLQQYPNLVGVCLNLNPDKTNVIFGEQTNCVKGQGFLREEFAGLNFHLTPETFFQVNTEAAEAVLKVIQPQLNLLGEEIIIDAYCGIGTLTLPLAKQLQLLASSAQKTAQKQVIGIEMQPTAVQLAYQNARLNGIDNVSFEVGTVETILSRLSIQPDIILLDPPRKGCDRTVLEMLLKLQPTQIVYVSCKPSTLARDLKILCENGLYHLTQVQPVDFFPQTPHVECVAFLQLSVISEQ
ncbi:MAG: 23S rRNA (uracil(1939)-C(5))-methyltransferase RlmD [Limnoraphis sp. WC205]|jgi:23S rRNA (uracil1939-C5)-methyltransferase|nr:23S rRNA (uracil(1939)-C(5))-methyltransferase RlmD [Limnoraphis sp. WC205]